jgi:hypothetical protein
VLLEIERKPVTSADEAVELSDNFKGSKVLLRVWSRGTTKYIFVTVGNGEQSEDPETREEREPANDQDR